MTMFNAHNPGNNPTHLSEEVPYHQKRDAHLQYVDVFMVDRSTKGNNRREAGHIYTVQQYEADSLVESGSAMLVDVAPLKLTQGKMDNLTKELKEAAEKIKNNERLSDIGRREELQLLVGQYEATADSLQAQYDNELEILKQVESTKAQQFKSNSNIDPYEARTQAGLLKAAVSVAPTVEASIEAIKSKLPSLDIAVARELLAQFSDIKRDIEAKKTGTSVQASATASRLIRELYAELETATTTPEQAQASAKYKMLEALARERDIRTTFKQTTRSLLRMY